MTARFFARHSRESEKSLTAAKPVPSCSAECRWIPVFAGMAASGLFEIPWAVRSGYRDSNMALTTV